MTSSDSSALTGQSCTTGSTCATVPKPDYYLHSDGVLVSAEACTVMTILGSCVSVCLWDPVRRIGGMNHFLLPHQTGHGARASRFGSTAVKLLIEKLDSLGCRRRDLHAKVFGGACINGIVGAEGSNLGAKNVEVAIAALELDGIPIISKDVGGNCGRKVLFRTDDGTAWVRKIGDCANGRR